MRLYAMFNALDGSDGPHALGARIRFVRFTQKLSVREMAEKLAVGQTTYYRWEVDGIRPPANMLRTLSRLIGIKPAVLQHGGPAWDAAAAAWREVAEAACRKPPAIATPPARQAPPPVVHSGRKAATRRPPCRTGRGCPHAPGWCSICKRQISHHEKLMMDIRRGRNPLLADYEA